MRQLAEALAEQGNKVLIWDRPNCGASDVCFEGSSESAMQADALAGLLTHLDMTPAIIAGGSGGARVSLLTAARHPETAAGLAIWWISGGVYGLLSLATHYCGGSVQAAWTHGMEAVADLPEWAEVQELNPSNRDRFLAQDPATFIAAMERWMQAYCPATTSPCPACPKRTPRRSTSRRWSSGAASATRITRGRPRRLWPASSPAHDWSSPRGETVNGLSGAKRATKGSSPAGRCWPPNSWSGRQKFWADRAVLRARFRRGTTVLLRCPGSPSTLLVALKPRPWCPSRARRGRQSSSALSGVGRARTIPWDLATRVSTSGSHERVVRDGCDDDAGSRTYGRPGVDRLGGGDLESVADERVARVLDRCRRRHRAGPAR